MLKVQFHLIAEISFKIKTSEFFFNEFKELLITFCITCSIYAQQIVLNQFELNELKKTFRCGFAFVLTIHTLNVKPLISKMNTNVCKKID